MFLIITKPNSLVSFGRHLKAGRTPRTAPGVYSVPIILGPDAADDLQTIPCFHQLTSSHTDSHLITGPRGIRLLGTISLFACHLCRPTWTLQTLGLSEELDPSILVDTGRY